MLAQFTAWIASLATAAFAALWSLIQDAAVAIFTALVTAVAGVIAAIPLPDWLSNGLSSLWDALPNGIIYLASAAGVPQGLAIIGAGFGFRLLRKIATLFQW